MNTIIKIGEENIAEQQLGNLLAQYQMLPKLAREIIIDRAIAGVECSAEEQQQAYEQFQQRYQIKEPQQLEAWLKQQGMSEAQLKHLVVRGLKLDRFKRQTWGAELESYFIKRRSQLDQVVYSLIRNQNPGIIQEIYFRIQDQESSFAQLAMEYSEGGEAQTGGLIGPVEIHAPHPKIAQMLSASRPGQLWPPTRVENWLVIVRLEKFITAQLDEQMQQRLLDELFQNWLKQQMLSLVEFQPNQVQATTSGI